MLIWKAKAAKSTGALKSVSVHQFDNTFTMKTSNCKAFSIDTRLQLRLQGLRKFRLFSFLQEVEKTSTVQYFFWNRDSVYGSSSLTKACIISDSGRHAATLWHRYLQCFLHCCRLTQQIPHSAFSSRLSLCCSLCGEICSAALTCSPCESIKRRKSSCSL